MVFGIYTSSLPEHRKPVAYPLLKMTERQAVAVTTFIVQQKLEEVKAMQAGNSVREAQHKRKKLTLEQRLEQLHKQQSGLEKRLQELGTEKHDAFNTFREILAKEEASKRQRELDDAKAGKVTHGTKVVQPLIRHAKQDEEPDFNTRKASLLSNTPKVTPQQSPGHTLATPTNKRAPGYPPPRPAQRPKLDQPSAPPPRTTPQSSHPTTPTVATPPAPNSLESHKPPAKRPSRWDPSPDHTALRTPAFQHSTRSPSDAAAPSAVWSQPRRSPSYPPSVGRSNSATSTPTEPLPSRRPDQGFPISPPRRQSRFAPAHDMGVAGNRAPTTGMSPTDISPDNVSVPRQAHLASSPHRAPRPRPTPRDDHPFNDPPPARQSRWGAPVDHLPPHARPPTSPGLPVSRPPDRSYPPPPRDYRGTPPPGRSGPPSYGPRPPYGRGSPRPQGPHIRDGHDRYRPSPRGRPPFGDSSGYYSERRDDNRHRNFGRGTPPDRRGRGRGHGGYRGRGRR
eukprot:m.60179 g.60179  ORF g.60179 m.60179 type:complete len:507 (-) comp13842_c0_seq1:77-1597(-)